MNRVLTLSHLVISSRLTVAVVLLAFTAMSNAQFRAVSPNFDRQEIVEIASEHLDARQAAELQNLATTAETARTTLSDLSGSESASSAAVKEARDASRSAERALRKSVRNAISTNSEFAGALAEARTQAKQTRSVVRLVLEDTESFNTLLETATADERGAVQKASSQTETLRTQLSNLNSDGASREERQAVREELRDATKTLETAVYAILDENPSLETTFVTTTVIKRENARIARLASRSPQVKDKLVAVADTFQAEALKSANDALDKAKQELRYAAHDTEEQKVLREAIRTASKKQEEVVNSILEDQEKVREDLVDRTKDNRLLDRRIDKKDPDKP